MSVYTSYTIIPKMDSMLNTKYILTQIYPKKQQHTSTYDEDNRYAQSLSCLLYLKWLEWIIRKKSPKSYFIAMFLSYTACTYRNIKERVA